MRDQNYLALMKRFFSSQTADELCPRINSYLVTADPERAPSEHCSASTDQQNQNGAGRNGAAHDPV